MEQTALKGFSKFGGDQKGFKGLELIFFLVVGRHLGVFKKQRILFRSFFFMIFVPFCKFGSDFYFIFLNFSF
jgi:hypothetical protein